MKKLRNAALFVLFLALFALFAVGGSAPVRAHPFGLCSATIDSYGGFSTGDWDITQGTEDGATPPTSSHASITATFFAVHTPTYYNAGVHVTSAFAVEIVGYHITYFGTGNALSLYGSKVAAHGGEMFSNYQGTPTAAWHTVDVTTGTGGPAFTSTDFYFDVTAEDIPLLGDVVLDVEYACGGTETPTPSATPTISGAPAGNFEGQCLLLGDDSSLFMTLPGAWTLDPSTLGHGTGGTGLKLATGQASIVLNLNKYHKYQIAIRYHVEDILSGDIFSFKLGSTMATTVSAEATVDEQTFVTADGGQNFEPDDPASSDIYTFTLKELLHVEDNGTLVIDLACIEDRTPDVQLVPQGGEDSPPGVCQSCDYTPTGNLLNDLMAIFAWLWCGLSQLFDCVLKPLLLGLWRAIIDILRWLNFVRIWAGLIWTNLGAWLGNAWTQFLYWLIGAMNNVQTAFKNIVFAFFDSPIGAFLVNALAAILNNPLSAIIANTAHTVETVAGSVGNIIQIGAYYLGLIFNAVVTILGAIPEIFIALVNGYNAAPTSIPVWAPTCNSANTFLYYPCLGSYILDNTLLDGPAYLMFILLLGLVAVNTILWTVRQLQEALAK